MIHTLTRPAHWLVVAVLAAALAVGAYASTAVAGSSTTDAGKKFGAVAASTWPGVGPLAPVTGKSGNPRTHPN